LGVESCRLDEAGQGKRDRSVAYQEGQAHADLSHPSSVLGPVERLSEAVCRYLRGRDVRELDRGAGRGRGNC
jgi:hypothetical protein